MPQQKTVRLPESLTERLTEFAERDGVSFNQYIVYLLTRSIGVEEIRLQRKQFDEMRSEFTPEERSEAVDDFFAIRGETK